MPAKKTIKILNSQIKTINVFGGSGFIGSRYCELTENVIKNSREDYKIKTNEVVYFISTIDNCNVFENPYYDIETNLTTLIKVLESANKDSETVFNYISTYFVYANKEEPINEADPCDPKGFYSITKRAAEQLLESYCKTFGMKYRIIRLSNVLGKGGKLRTNGVTQLFESIKNNEDVDLYDCGSHKRDFIYVDDVIQGINIIIDQGCTNEIYNLGSGASISILELMQKYKEKVNSSSLFGCKEPPHFHKVCQQLKHFYMDISKIKSLGYKPQYDIDQIIKKLCKQ